MYYRIEDKMAEICHYKKSLCCRYIHVYVLFTLFLTLFCTMDGNTSGREFIIIKMKNAILIIIWISLNNNTSLNIELTNKK